MAGKKKRGRSSAQSQDSRIPSTMPEKDLLKRHEPEFVVNSITKSGSIFKCDVGAASFDGKPLTGIKCSTYKEVDDCFKKRQENNYSFTPISAYTHGDEILLLGEYVGENFKAWVANNFASLFAANGEFTNEMIDIGKQVLKIVTTNHQKGVFLGNIEEGMYINDQSKVIIIPNFETTGVELKDGIKKDLADLKGFMKVLESYVKKALSVSSSMLKAFALFLELFPENLWLQEDENKLKMSSYIICHNPMFWRLSERYLFSGIALKIFELRKDAKKMFERTIPIDEGLTDVEHWWDKVSCLVLPNALREVYDYGVSQIATSYSDERSIIPFIRNTFQHYHQYDPNATIEDIDNEINQTLPNVHLKIYVAMASPNNGICFDTYLRDGKINYCK